MTEVKLIVIPLSILIFMIYVIYKMVVTGKRTEKAQKNYEKNYCLCFMAKQVFLPK